MKIFSSNRFHTLVICALIGLIRKIVYFRLFSPFTYHCRFQNHCPLSWLSAFEEKKSHEFYVKKYSHKFYMKYTWKEKTKTYLKYTRRECFIIMFILFIFTWNQQEAHQMKARSEIPVSNLMDSFPIICYITNVHTSMSEMPLSVFCPIHFFSGRLTWDRCRSNRF